MSVRDQIIEILASQGAANPGGLSDDVALRDLGISSLHMMALLGTLEARFGIRLVIADLQSATVGDLIRRGLALRPVHTETRELEASIEQRHFWLLEQLVPRIEAARRADATAVVEPYVRTAAFALEGALDEELVRRCLAAVARRHEAFRTSFVLSRGVVRQAVAPAVELLHRSDDLSQLPAEARSATVRSVIAAERATRFSLAKAPLVRTRLLRLGERDAVLVVAGHAAVIDRTSFGVLCDELRALLATRGDDSTLVTAPSFADHAAWQARSPLAPRLDARCETLRTAPRAVPLPGRRPPESSSGPRLCSTRLDQIASLELTAAALAAMLWRWTGVSDLVLGLEHTVRTEELARVIGNFSRVTPLRITIDPSEPSADFVKRVAALVRAARAELPVGLDTTVAALAPPRGGARNPLYNAALCFEDTGPDARRTLRPADAPSPDAPPPDGPSIEEAQDLEDARTPAGSFPADVDLRWVVVQEEAGLHIECRYEWSWDRPPAAQALVDRLAEYITTLARNRQDPLGALAFPRGLPEPGEARSQLAGAPMPDPRARPPAPASPDDPELSVLEEVVGDIFAQVLELDRAAGGDDFFASGGDSLRAVFVRELVSSRLGIEIDGRALVEAPTVRGLARYLSGRREPSPDAGARRT